MTSVLKHFNVKFVIEILSAVLALSFFCSAAINHVIFALNGLNYFAISSTNDVILDGIFLLIISIMNFTGIISYFVLVDSTEHLNYSARIILQFSIAMILIFTSFYGIVEINDISLLNLLSILILIIGCLMFFLSYFILFMKNYSFYKFLSNFFFKNPLDFYMSIMFTVLISCVSCVSFGYDGGIILLDEKTSPLCNRQLSAKVFWRNENQTIIDCKRQMIILSSGNIIVYKKAFN